MRLDSKGEYWFRRQELQASTKPEYLGPGMLARSKYTRCDGHFYLHKKEPKGRKNKRSRCDSQTITDKRCPLGGKRTVVNIQ